MMNIYKTLGNHEPRIPPPPISTPRQTDTLKIQRPIAYRSRQPPKWSGSKKSWMRSSCANKTALMTKTTGTQILVHISPTTPSFSALSRCPIQKTSPTNTECRIRHLLHRLGARRRNPLRAHPRATRHDPRLHTAQRLLKSQHHNLVAQVRVVHGRQDAVGREHECAAVGRPVGAGV
jgi:hypothetical protein